MTDRELEQRLLIACAVAREAGHLAYDYFLKRDTLEVEHKGMQDLVSEADREVEELIRTRLGVAFPDDALLGEEGGDGESEESDDASDDLLLDEDEDGDPKQPPPGQWIIDPIDGTANFLRGMPYWSVALAYLVDGKPTIAVTYDPVHDDLFWARRGAGAYRNERPMRVKDCEDPKDAVIGSTFTFKMKIEDYSSLLDKILKAGADHRRMGSTALMMSHVADGRIDGCATMYCNSWDVIGGLLLVEEAGGVASEFTDGATLTEPNKAFGCATGLKDLVADMVGVKAREREAKSGLTFD